MREFYLEHLDLLDNRQFDILTCYTLATWRLEDFNAVPYLFFLGPLSSGKTRALECLQRLCFRPILAANLTPAVLFRVLEAWKPTMLLDETEIYQQKSMLEIRSLLNSGYRREGYAYRIAYSENGKPKLQSFDVFGFKALAGTRGFTSTLESRCIEIHMQKADRKIRFCIDEDKAKQIRSKLLMYRFRKSGHIIPFTGAEGFNNGRIAELFYPLLSVAPTHAAQRLLEEYALELVNAREEDEKTSIEAQFVRALLDSHTKVTQGRISIKDIAGALNEDTEVKQQWNPRTVGWIAKRLGLPRARMPDRKAARGVLWDSGIVKRLAKRYGLEDRLPALKLDQFCPATSEEMSETTETSETHTQTHARSDVTDISDVNLGTGKTKNICEECWRTPAYQVLESKGTIECLGEVAEDICEDCGKRSAGVKIRIH